MKYILILEDDGDLAAGMEMALMGDDFVFTVCGSIKEAEERLRQQAFDLLILDVNLPDGSGFELCRKIRKNSKVSIILLTARDMELDIVRGLECGADDYITKPFSMPVLIRKIAAVLRRSGRGAKAGENQKLIYRDLCLDLDNYQTFVDGEPVALTKREFEILRELLNHQGKVMTREILLEKLWKYEFYGNDRVVDNHIKNLRRKLERDYIETVKGIGYRIDRIHEKPFDS